MRLSTNNNLFDHVNLLRVEHINHIGSQDWTLDELDAFAAFVQHIAEASGVQNVAGELYKRYLWHKKEYQAALDVATLEELEDTDNDYFDDLFLSCKLDVEDMAAELILYREIPYFKSVYAESL